MGEVWWQFLKGIGMMIWAFVLPVAFIVAVVYFFYGITLLFDL